MNEQQRAAVDATGEVFVSAGAGTGKTAVLVERFVRAVCDRGLDVDSILVITYTRRAAGELRLQIPLYMLVLRDLVGLEPLGGVYRPLAGERKARGLLRSSEGDVGHDPKGGDCPAWCDLWSICRVTRG